MDIPRYELEPLKTAVLQCKTNIINLEKAINAENVKIRELEVHIREWELYNEWLKTQE